MAADHQNPANIQANQATVPSGGPPPPSGVRIGRIFGIPIYLHASWFIIFALITLSRCALSLPRSIRVGLRNNTGCSAS